MVLSHCSHPRHDMLSLTSSVKALHRVVQSTSDPSGAVTTPAAPLLALPGKQYPLKFDGSDFQINGKFVRLPNGEACRRNPRDQQDADTADSVWDSSVVYSSSRVASVITFIGARQTVRA